MWDNGEHLPSENVENRAVPVIIPVSMMMMHRDDLIAFDNVVMHLTTYLKITKLDTSEKGGRGGGLSKLL